VKLAPSTARHGRNSLLKEGDGGGGLWEVVEGHHEGDAQQGGEIQVSHQVSVTVGCSGSFGLQVSVFSVIANRR
jgi:hypothetical protein